MKSILIIKNEPNTHLGLLEGALKKQKLHVRIIEAHRGLPLPKPQDFSAVIVYGGAASANNYSPWMKNEVTFAKEVLKNNIPYLGICLGMQILVKAGGGNVHKHTVAEIGFTHGERTPYVVKLTSAGSNDTLFTGIPSSFPVFHMHYDTVELTNDMLLLGTGKSCPVQAVRVGSNAYGIQSHFELDEKMFNDWISTESQLKKIRHLETDYKLHKKTYEKTGSLLFTNFIRIAQEHDQSGKSFQ
jgi:GMP synthase (glutamine-hydrolysing)